MLVLYLTTPMFDGKLTDVQRNQDIEASHDVHLQIDALRSAGEDGNCVIFGAGKSSCFAVGDQLDPGREKTGRVHEDNAKTAVAWLRKERPVKGANPIGVS